MRVYFKLMSQYSPGSIFNQCTEQVLIVSLLPIRMSRAWISEDSNFPVEDFVLQQERQEPHIMGAWSWHRHGPRLCTVGGGGAGSWVWYGPMNLVIFIIKAPFTSSSHLPI